MASADLTYRLKRSTRNRTDGAVSSTVRLGEYVTFITRAIAAVPYTLVHYRKHVLNQIAEVTFGNKSLLSGGGTLGIVLAMSLAAAMMLGVETYRGLQLVGMTSMSGMLSAIANTRELAPVVVAIALAAKVGTGFTAQIGAMRISDEIAALDVMAIRSIPFLATTRMIAAMVCILPIYMIGLLSSYIATRLVVVWFNGESSGTYDYFFHLALQPSDLLYSAIKAVAFAAIVTLVHCSYGYFASGGPEGVGQAAGRALRTSILAIGIFDVIFTFGLWGLVPEIPGMGI